jgi:hypothetical protein
LHAIGVHRPVFAKIAHFLKGLVALRGLIDPNRFGFMGWYHFSSKLLRFGLRGWRHRFVVGLLHYNRDW